VTLVCTEEPVGGISVFLRWNWRNGRVGLEREALFGVVGYDFLNVCESDFKRFKAVPF